MSRWEFNAPKYVDLSKLPTEGPEDDGADAWFESPEALAGEQAAFISLSGRSGRRKGHRVDADALFS